MLPSLASLQIGVHTGEKRKLEKLIPDDVAQEELLLEMLLERQKARTKSEKDKEKEEAEARRSQMETQKLALEQRLLPFGAKINDTKTLVVLQTVDVLVEKTQLQDRREVPEDGRFDKTYTKTIEEGIKYTVYVDDLKDEYVCLRMAALLESNYRKFTLKLYVPWAFFDDKKVAFE